ncbi:MAG: hypothetical protein A2293_13670 [Elusimicrobia bacterium RIFOXYB2_FULL_49_7]|nr:MAG: hypothetical protein A2293_13670 [Elusimicrobia bacterium RIFOXYB2_FULL_49_7]
MRFVSYAHFFAVIVYLCMMLFVLVRNPRSALNRSCAAALFCFAVWGGAMALLHSRLLTWSEADFVQRFGAIGWLFFPVFFLRFSALLAGFRQLASSRWLWSGLLLMATGFTVYFFIHPFVQITEMRSFGWGEYWRRCAGTSLYIAYYLLLTSIGFLLVFLKRHQPLSPYHSRVSWVMLIGGGATFLSGTLSNVVMDWMGIFSIPPLGDVFVMMWAIGMVYAIYRYRFMDMTPAIAAETLLSNMEDMVFLLDLQGRIVFVNRAVLVLSDYDREALEQESAELLFPGQGIVKRCQGQLFSRVALHDIDMTLQKKEAQITLPISMTISVVPGAGFICVCREITFRKQRQLALEQSLVDMERSISPRIELLRQMNEQLKEDAQKDKSRIFHHLRNLFSAISGFAELIIIRFGKDNDKLKEYAEMIVTMTQKAGELTAGQPYPADFSATDGATNAVKMMPGPTFEKEPTDSSLSAPVSTKNKNDA